MEASETNTLQTIISGLSSGYEGIEPIIVGTAIIPTRNPSYPNAWRDGGLIKDSYNQRIIKKLANKIYRELMRGKASMKPINSKANMTYRSQ